MFMKINLVFCLATVLILSHLYQIFHRGKGSPNFSLRCSNLQCSLRLYKLGLMRVFAHQYLYKLLIGLLFNYGRKQLC